MYVIVDRESLVFLARHRDVYLLCDFAALEYPSTAYDIQVCDEPCFLKDYTELEIGMLYRNTTGTEQALYGDKLRLALALLVAQLPELSVDHSELQAQLAVVPEDNEVPYKYVPGARRPVVKSELFVGVHAKVPKHNQEAQFVATGPSAWQQLYPDITRPVRTPAAQPAEGRTKPRTGPARPRLSGVKDIVWAQADVAWERCGKPTVKTEVLAMRKALMQHLEAEFNVGRNTSSNELGKWQKARIPQII